MRFKYNSDVPRNVRKAFAERVRQAKIRGGGEEYEHLITRRMRGVEISLDVARFALRKRKVSRETLKTPEQQFLERAQYWRKHGLEASSRYQSTMKRYREGTLKNVARALPQVRGYKLKVERLNALLEELKEYIYEMSTSDDEASKIALDAMTDDNRDMFDIDKVDDYITMLEQYKVNRHDMVEWYKDYVDRI